MRIALSTLQVNNQKQNLQNTIKFAGINKMLSSNNESIKNGKVIVTDIFECTGEDLNQVFERSVNSIWNKIQEQSCTFTPQKLETAITEVKKANPDNSDEEILTVMQKLTQWANYSCFKPLSEKLNLYDFKTVYTSFDNSLDDVFYYLITRKKLCKINRENSTYYSFVTKNNVDDICDSRRMIAYINLEGFDDGVNILSDENQLAPLTSNVLAKVNDYMHNNPQISFKRALSYVLNNEILSKLKLNGLYADTISIDKEPTRNVILEQMSPVLPQNKETIKNLIENLADYFEPFEKDENLLLKTRIAQFYDQKIDIYTKQRLINLMKEMQSKIIAFQERKNLPQENTYYLIKGQLKSYSIITQMFARLNKIPENKIFYNMDDGKCLPLNSTIVILDDIAISGESLQKIQTHTLRDDINVLFCPLIAHKNAINAKLYDIKMSKRSNKDHILNIITKNNNLTETREGKIITDYFNKSSQTFSVLGDNGFENKQNTLGGCTTLPYMSPDNNAELSSFLLLKFLPNRYAIKNIHYKFDDVMCKFNKTE